MIETKVLLVDDERENIRYLTIILEENGFKNIFSASNGEEGLKQVEAVNPGLIVLDIRMPRKSGIQMFNDLKTVSRFKRIPIIVLTGEGEFLKRLQTLRSFHEGEEVKLDKSAEEVLSRLIDDRPQAFLEKPIEPEVFMETVRKVLTKG
jgi:CheY-like chemotaxis protein